MKLWLARHAVPLIEPGICYGSLDIEADASATQACARALAAALPQGLPVRVSGLRRADQLAQALAALRGDLRPVRDERLNEMDFGTWEGVPWLDISQADIDAWTRDFSRYRAGGAECVSDVLRRVAQALAETAADAEAVWITHAGVIRAAHYLARHGATAPTAASWPAQAPAFGQWTLLLNP
ncbi:MAG: histidine phosphatase family protein [Bordetella sp.]|uniref:histidine phosphatase family protein n=1 Tax=Bordetella sp. TaxID=28081 RepID=UPI003F7C9776